MITIIFKNKKELEAEICGTDIHQNLIIELITEDYNSVKDILLDKEATSEITADGQVFYDFTNVKYLNSSITEDGKTRVKAALTYGKDFTNALADVVSKVDTLQADTTVMTDQISGLENQVVDLEESQTEQDEAIEYLMTEEEE